MHSTVDFEDNHECDRFTVGIPYCGTQIEWEVIFNRNHPSLPPDIIFSSEDDQMEFIPDIERLKAYSVWSLDRPNCLSQLLEELLMEYRLHHRTILAQFHRLYFELDTLVQNNAYTSVDVHCSRSPNESSFEPIARFYIPLRVDFSAIPAYLTKDNPGPDIAALVVTFYPPDASRVVPVLFLSPRVERVLGGSGALRLPPWGGELGSCLMDYVPRVHTLLEEKVQTIVQSYIKRKECVAAFLSIFGQAVLEYDTEAFKKLAFFFEYLGFSFVAMLELSDDFPQEQPRLILRSVYHKAQGVPCQRILTDYPYSPRWNADEKAERMRSYLMQVAPQFMELSKEQGECL